MSVLKTALGVWLGVILAFVATPLIVLSLIFLGAGWMLVGVLSVVACCLIVTGVVVIARDWPRRSA